MRAARRHRCPWCWRRALVWSSVYDPESGINNATWSCERHLSKARRKIGWID